MVNHNYTIVIIDHILIYNDHEIIIDFDKNNQPWFSAIQVAKILEYSNTIEAIRTNVPKYHKLEPY